MRLLRKYLLLYAAMFRASFAADLEFRLNFAVKIVTDVVWYASQILGFELLFNFTPRIGDWSREETRIFLGILFVVDAISMVCFHGNLNGLSELVRRGQLDLLLAKPVNSQFMVSLQRATTAHLGNLVVGLVFLFWACLSYEQFSWARAVWLLVLIPPGCAIFYVTMFFFSSASVIFARAENLQYLWYHLYRLGVRPDTIYPLWLKYIVLSVLPMGFVASVPARVVLGNGSLYLVPWALFVAALSLWLSSRLWTFALSRYSSASS